MRPPVSDSATPKVRPWATRRSATATSIDSSSTPKTMSPKAALDGPAHLDLLLVEQRADVVERAGPRRDAHLDALDARGEEGQGDVARLVERVDALLEGLGQARLAGAPGAQDPAGDDALLPRLGHAGAQVGQDGPLEHLGHLVGHARDRVDDLVAHGADEAGCRPDGLGDDGGAHGHVGLARVVGRHGAAPGREEAGDASTMAWSRTSSTFMTSAMASRVMSSWVGPRPPHMMTPSLRASAVRRASVDAVVVVADGLVEVRRHAVGGQLVAQPGGVGVGDLAEQQLGAHRDDLDPHGRDLRGRWVGAAPGGRRAGTRRRCRG